MNIGRCLKAPRNIQPPLQYLRDPGMAKKLCVDAICINQDDLYERGHQVQIMGLIHLQSSQLDYCLAGRGVSYIQHCV